MHTTSRNGPLALAAVALLAFTALVLGARGAPAARAQACPPYCPTPLITPAWHLHMCDEAYEDQIDDNHCMIGPGVTEFGDGVDAVFTIYCHQREDTVVVYIRDSGGGLQYVNHPDGETYPGSGCESLEWSRRGGIPSAGSPYYTSLLWPEGPFSGVGAGIEWYIGLYVRLDAESYYGRSAMALLTARDPAANLSPTQRDEIEAWVSSTSDPVGFAIKLREELPSFPLFRAVVPVRFSLEGTDAASAILKVAHGDTVTVRYCPRDCAAPYTDSATWYDMEATITPTPLATWPGPPAMPTVPPAPTDTALEYLVLRPAEADVGYVPQISAQKDRPNHLGYPWILAGMWSRGRSIHYGMVQFDLASVPEGTFVHDARLDLVGRDPRFMKPGVWRVNVLGSGVDDGWRGATYDVVHSATVVGQVGGDLRDGDLTAGHMNSLAFGPGALAALRHRLETTRRISLRVDGPVSDENNLFGWHSGVDVYQRDPEPPDPALGPSLFLAYGHAGSRPSETPPTATITATLDATAVPTPTPLPTSDPTDPPDPTSTPAPTATITPVEPPVPTATLDAPTATLAPTATSDAQESGRRVCVVAYDDRNGDGRRDRDERLLPGATLRLTHVATGMFVTWTTDAANDPDHCWDGLQDGEYGLAITSLPTWFEPTGPVELHLAVPIAAALATFEFGARRAWTATASPPSTRPPTETATALPPAPSDTPSAEPTGNPSATEPRSRHRVALPLAMLWRPAAR